MKGVKITKKTLKAYKRSDIIENVKSTIHSRKEGRKIEMCNKKLDYSKVRGRIVEKYKTIGKFAESSGIRAEQFTDAFNGRRSFTSMEIMRICELLEIPDEEIKIYFFAEET